MAYKKKTKTFCKICKKTVDNIRIHLKYEHSFPPKIVNRYFELNSKLD